MMVGCFVGGNDSYSSQKVYKLAFEGLQVPRTFQWLWNSKCVPRIKFFAWLLMVDRLNTKTMLRRRHYNTQVGIFCVLCSHNSEEDIEHLFFCCPFAANCWLRLNIVWDLDLELHHRISQARSIFQHDFYMEAFLIGAWELWKIRNAVIFDNARPSVHLWSVKFREQLLLHLVRFNNVIKDSVVS